MADDFFVSSCNYDDGEFICFNFLWHRLLDLKYNYTFFIQMVQVLLNGVLLGRTFTTTEIYIFFISEVLIHVVACLHVNVFALITF